MMESSKSDGLNESVTEDSAKKSDSGEPTPESSQERAAKIYFHVEKSQKRSQQQREVAQGDKGASQF